MKHKKRFKIAALILGLISISLLLYPTVSNAVYQICAGEAAVKYSRSTSTLSKAEKEKILSLAQRYNENLVGLPNDSTTFEYEDILNFNDGQICTIEIPKIDVNLPVYHESNEALKKGAVHAKNSSFPIGGENTNCVIEAHTGYPGKVLFDNLDELEKGDKIYIHILDETLVYEVSKKDIVKPEETDIKIESGDKLSLVTCYPYGINSHRLIVTCVRDMAAESTSDETVSGNTSCTISDYFPIFVIVLVFATVVTAALIYIFKARSKKRAFLLRGDESET